MVRRRSTVKGERRTRCCPIFFSDNWSAVVESESRESNFSEIWSGGSAAVGYRGVIVATVPMMTITTTLQDPFGELPPWAPHG